MSLPALTHTLRQWGDDYLVLDVNFLFVAASLREEVWLFRQQEDTELLARVCQNAAEFQIRDVDPDREWATYSGGEQAILAALMIINLVRSLELTHLHLILCGVLESISQKKRNQLGRHFAAAASTHQLRVFCMNDNRIDELVSAPCTS